MHASEGIVLLLCIMNLAPRRWIVAVILGLLAGCSDSPKNTFEGYKARAERGDPVAQFNLGNCYADGEGVAKDQVQAVSWYRKAAKQGNANAQFNLGVCYHYGEGVAKDQVEAYAYYNLVGIKYDQARKALAIFEKRMSHDFLLRGQQRTKQLQKEIESEMAGK